MRGEQVGRELPLAQVGAQMTRQNSPVHARGAQNQLGKAARGGRRDALRGVQCRLEAEKCCGHLRTESDYLAASKR